MNDSTHSGDKRFAQAAVWLSLLLAVLLVAGIWLYTVSRPALLSMQAREAAFAGAYDRAGDCLNELMNTDADAAYPVILSVASIADYRGDWEAASQMLNQQLRAGGDSEAYTAFAKEAEALLEQCVYHQAMELYEQGDYAKASGKAATIGHYEPARMLYQLSYQALLASQPTPEPTAPTLTPASEPMQTPTAVNASAVQNSSDTPEPVATPAPAVLGDGRVAVGYHHAVFLKNDGTVLAFGDNSYGQTEVGEWRDIVAVAAGAYHTVGLTADGRVLAVGDNTHGQIDVSLYTNVKQIAANAWDTCLLLQSGQALSVGYHDYGFLLELMPVEKLAAGSYGVIALSQGRIVASHPSLALSEGCEQLAVSRGYAVGVDATGKVVSTTELIPAWENVVQISAGENAVLALDADGHVLSHTFDSHVKCSFDFGQPVLAIAAGPNQYAFVLQDGSIEIRYADGTVFKPEIKLW